MIPCKDIRAGLDDWLDGVATEPLRREIDLHLAECDACTRFFASHRHLADDLLILSDAGNRMADAARPHAAKSGSPRWHFLVRAAVILLVAGLGLYVTKPWRAGAPGPVTQNVQPRDAEPERPSPPVFHITVPKNRIAVRIESANPRIHIVWLYSEIPPPGASNDEKAEDLPGLPS